MSVRIGKVEIKATTRVDAVEARRSALMGAPGHAGAVGQDLGHEPTIILLEGTLFGEGATADLEALRFAWSKAEPQALAADIAAGSQITEVIIEDVQARQRAGTKDTFLVSLRLREHTEPPAKAGAGFSAVAGGIMKDAGKWMKLAASVAKVIQDPSCLMEELAKNAELLDVLGIDDLADAMLDHLEELLPEELAGIIRAVREIDPTKARALVEKILTSKDPLDFLAKGGLETLQEVGRSMGFEVPLPPGAVGAVKAAVAVANDPGLIDDIKELVASAQRLGGLLSKPETLLPGGAA